MSTIGASPETVTVSCSAPTLISAFTVAVNSAGSWMPSRFSVLKPCSENVTVYGPGRRSTTRKRPLASVTADFDPSMSAGTAGLDGHARQHAAGRVADDAGDAALGKGGRRQEHEPEHDDETRDSLNPICPSFTSCSAAASAA